MTFTYDEVKPHIWNSFEMYCICRDFSYKDYVELHAYSAHTHGVISENFYGLIKQGFNTQMHEDFTLQSVV